MFLQGDRFEAGTAICEVETDKATVTYDATEDGFIAKILVGTGEVKVGQPMMITVDDAKDVAAFASYNIAPSATSTPAPSPAKTAPVAAPPAAAVATPPKPPSTPAPAAAAVASSGSRVVASPLARKLLRDAGLGAQALEVTNS